MNKSPDETLIKTWNEYLNEEDKFVYMKLTDLVEHTSTQRMQEPEAFLIVKIRFSDAVEQIQSLLSAHGLRSSLVHGGVLGQGYN